MKIDKIQEKLDQIIQYGGLVGLDYEYREAVAAASILIDEIIKIRDEDCKCDGNCEKTCNYRCELIKLEVRQLINNALKESEIEEDENK